MLLRTDPAFSIEIRNLRKSFDRPAVDGLDLSIRRGEFYTLLGPNGAGKTTTLRMVVGLLRPDAGSIAILGIDALADPVAAKQVMAWISDEPMIYDKLTPFEYLEFVGGLGHRCFPRRDAGAGIDRLARPRPPRPSTLRGLFQGHAPEGGARRRARARAEGHHPR
jgi:ABC-type multidrug transport system ATPase subunit